MFGLGWGELLIILLIVLAVFGTSRIAGLGGALGGSIREFKKAVQDETTDTTTVSKVEPATTVTRVEPTTTTAVAPTVVAPTVDVPEQTNHKV